VLDHVLAIRWVTLQPIDFIDLFTDRSDIYIVNNQLVTPYKKTKSGKLLGNLIFLPGLSISPAFH